MRQIVRDIIAFTKSETMGLSLLGAQSIMEARDLRELCVKLLGWWGRPTLMASDHPEMAISMDYLWCQRLARMIQVTPELQDLVELTERSCRFAAPVSIGERQRINDFVKENYTPPSAIELLSASAMASTVPARQPETTIPEKPKAGKPSKRIKAEKG
ncbi:MAG TPA: hypothetical protein VMZ27_04560 [Candidatus Saccharimonadales bacterium]|nr:hypothetical protein [Candidatus Saccharimonadales bacterium]